MNLEVNGIIKYHLKCIVYLLTDTKLTIGCI